ncbi:unnamed protein product [Spirodela intermedia]|uniref:Uncharacterized protein n=1 Tax=Spirodela intermedia TaxID=51605 RepID=A0A7I8K948_SPIIN|nr:unnamed protein product [Spirodela intermedia]
MARLSVSRVLRPCLGGGAAAFSGGPSLGYSAEEPLKVRLSSALRSCCCPGDLPRGRQIHAQIIVNGIPDLQQLQARVLGMYMLCGSFSDGRSLFIISENRIPMAWNWMIRGSAMAGLFELSLLLYFKMFSYGVAPDRYTFLAVLRACVGLRAPDLGSLIHGTLVSMKMEADPFLGSSLIKLYADNGLIGHARKVFDGILDRDSVLWNVMIDAYVRNRNSREALALFNAMRSSETAAPPNEVSLACVLSVCASEGKLGHGAQIHGLAMKFGLDMESSVANTLLSMYAKCRCWAETTKLFEEMPPGFGPVAWNGMISGYAQNGMEEEAVDFLRRMQVAGVRPDSVTLVSVLPLFSCRASLKKGEEIHAYIIRNVVDLDAFLKSALVDLYLKCREVGTAAKVFRETGTVDVVIVSAMISGYVLNGYSGGALAAFRELVAAEMKPNAITIASVLPACASLAALKAGKELHCHALKNAMEEICFVGSALIDMYAKCGCLDLAHQIFERMPERDSISWNSMISSFAQNGSPEEALRLFRRIVLQGAAAPYDCTTISSALSACANLPSLRHGTEIHGHMLRRRRQIADIFTESALVDMYAKCGDLAAAGKAFDAMEAKNEVSWNSIIAAYGSHGHLPQAAVLFEGMLAAGFLPDHVTFLSLLSACGHAGEVERGFQFFRRMAEEFAIAARMEHYACMVDLFGRAGRLEEAMRFIQAMPFPADAGVWGALLGACRMHGGATEFAELASQHLLRLDPCNSGYYVLMANVHAVAGRWEGASKVRNLMKERRVQKPPGCSWIEMAGGPAARVFVAADTAHPECPMIYSLLRVLLLQLGEEGYVPQTSYL